MSELHATLLEIVIFLLKHTNANTPVSPLVEGVL